MTAHEDAATRGTALLVRRAAFAAEANIATEVRHDGRALAVTMSSGASMLTAVALHHYDMTVASANTLSRRIREIVDEAQRDPMNKLAVLDGDFNYDAPEEATAVDWWAERASPRPRVASRSHVSHDGAAPAARHPLRDGTWHRS